MVKSDNVVPCKYVLASHPAQNFVWKVIFFLSTEHQTNFTQSSKDFSPYLSN